MRLGLLIATVAIATSSPVLAEAQSSTTTKKPTTTTTTTTKKPTTTTTTKPATTTTSKPAAAKPTTTTATKPAAKDTTTKTGTAAAKPTTPPPSTTTPAKPTTTPTTTKPATNVAAAPTRTRVLPPDEKSVGIMGGVALGDLGFDMGPTGGLSYRYKRGTWPIAIRGEALFSHFSQTPESADESASLSHFGATLGVEYPLAPSTSSLQPYIVAGGGVFRFQADGPAGANGDIAGGVFTSTTDVAGFGGAGIRFSRRVFVEARFLSVGDFYSVPLVLGFQF